MDNIYFKKYHQKCYITNALPREYCQEGGSSAKLGIELL